MTIEVKRQRELDFIETCYLLTATNLAATILATTACDLNTQEILPVECRNQCTYQKALKKK